MARQPIFDRHLRVFGYELLFRAGAENYFVGNRDYAASRLISDSALLDLRSLTGGKRAFINFPRSCLVQGFATLLPKEAVVVEILEDVKPDAEVTEACRRLKAAGYLIALDDFEFDGAFGLIDLADFIKVDFLATSAGDRSALARHLGKRNIRMLAEKVETRDVVDQAKEDGYEYFQGYFFSKPEMVRVSAVPGLRLNYVRWLEALNRPDVELAHIESIAKQDLSISYRLLRYINSAAFGFRTHVTSLRHALVLAGLNQVRRWASMWALAELGSDKPHELLVLSLVRARFCELLSQVSGLGEQGTNVFLTGLFSLLDAILDRPMYAVLYELSLPPEIRAALLEHDGPLGGVLQTVVAYEQADWPRTAALAARLGAEEAHVARCYRKATEWAQQICDTGGLASQS